MIPWLLRKGPTAARRSPELTLSDDERRAAHMAASLLLDYPEKSRRDAFPAIAAATEQLPEMLRDAFARFFEEIENRGQGELEAHYTETFDEKRKCCLYLTYYAAGDTRRRGMALVRFVEAYREEGWEGASGELPDYLPVVLEFSARTGSTNALELLGAHREGVEVLKTALEKLESPYRHLVEAVCLALPEIDDVARERYRKLITEGPPVEMVGLGSVPITLEPYSPGGRVHEEVAG